MTALETKVIVCCMLLVSLDVSRGTAVQQGRMQFHL